MSTVTTTETLPIPAGSTWTADKVHSTVGFAVKHMVVSTFRSSFDRYDATLTAAEDGTLRLEGTVDAGSVVLKDENLAAHLSAPDSRRAPAPDSLPSIAAGMAAWNRHRMQYDG